MPKCQNSIILYGSIYGHNSSNDLLNKRCVNRNFLFWLFRQFIDAGIKLTRKRPLYYLPINLEWSYAWCFWSEDHDRIFEFELRVEHFFFSVTNLSFANQDIFDAKTIFPSDREHKKVTTQALWVVDFIEFQTGIVKNKGVTTCLDTSVFITHLSK